MKLERRENTKEQGIYLVMGDRDIPIHRNRNFLKSSHGKQKLAIFLSEYLFMSIPGNLKASNKFLSGGFANNVEFHTITKESTFKNFHLTSNHEETDTRIILHLMLI